MSTPNKLRFEHESARLKAQMAKRKVERHENSYEDNMDIVKKLMSYSPTSGYSRVMVMAAFEIERLRDYIREHGKQTNICTKHILGEVCEDCRCGKK